MVERIDAVAQSPPCRCHSFLYFAYFFISTLSHFIQLGLAPTTYILQEIMNIGIKGFIPPPPPNIPNELLHASVPTWITTLIRRWHRQRWERRQKRGKQAGIHARLKSSLNKPTLPNLFITNTQSIVNKIDELRLRISSNKMNSCTSFFIETWLNVNIPDVAIELAGRTVYRSDRTAESSKDKSSWVCIFVNNAWCTS